MKKFNVMILAGSDRENWYKYYGAASKPFLPIHDKPMIEWVIKAFHGSKRIDKIIVIGPDELDHLASMRYVHKRLPSKPNLLMNLLSAAIYMKTRLYHCANDHDGYLISFCDAPLLSPEIIDSTLKSIDDSNADICLNYVSKNTFKLFGLPIEDRSYLHIGKGDYTGSNIYYSKKLRYVLNGLNILRKIRQYRKDPKKILAYLGLTGADFDQIERRIEQVLKVKARVFVSPYPEMGIDVDKPSDYELVKEIISTPFHERIRRTFDVPSIKSEEPRP